MINMSLEILHVINAVRDYKRFITSNNYIVQNQDFDWFTETEKYYHSLPLPKGMKRNRADFNRIINFDNNTLSQLNNTNYSDLHYTEWK